MRSRTQAFGTQQLDVRLPVAALRAVATALAAWDTSPFPVQYMPDGSTRDTAVPGLVTDWRYTELWTRQRTVAPAFARLLRLGDAAAHVVNRTLAPLQEQLAWAYVSKVASNNCCLLYTSPSPRD